MKGGRIIVFVFAFTLCFNFVSAGFMTDIFGRITGNVIADIGSEEFIEEEFDQITCEDVKSIENFEIPKAIPFKTDVFDIYMDDEFFVSIELEESIIKLILCEKSEETTYNIYATSEFILNSIKNSENIKPLDLYFDSRDNGDLKIEPVGVARKLKMSFINFGIKIASFFD